jgi:hypothetical protein
MSRGTLERTLHIKQGQCIFATSNSVDDGLVAHLLRRGVISLRDREEVAKRLLSNKRVGTILLEMGVLDETDLRAMVCEQLSEVVFDTIRWEDGEFVFVPGELPTNEEITLSDSVEDLVAAGLRRITAWSRVQAGCGSPEAVLALTPEYLAVLDRMRLSTDAWDVASALKQPRSVREVCRATQLSSFRACQILWTLRLLGAVAPGVAEVEPVQDAAETAVAFAVEAFRTAVEEDPTPIAVAAPAEDAVLLIAAEATRWIPDAAEENRVLPLAADDASAELLHDLWRLAAEKAPDRPMRAEAAAEEPAEAPQEPEAPEAPELAEPVEEPEPESPPMELDREPTAGAMAFAEPAPESASPPEPVAFAFAEPGEPATFAVDESAAASADDPGTTMQLSRDEVEAAIASRPAEAVAAESFVVDAEPVVAEPVALESALAEPDTAAFDTAPLESAVPTAPQAPPLDEADIARFNARQRLVYRSIRAEVGAGAANFVRSCRTDLFAEAELAADGTWDAEVLRNKPAEAFERFLEAQLDRLTQHIGRSRAEALREQIRKL